MFANAMAIAWQNREINFIASLAEMALAFRIKGAVVSFLSGGSINSQCIY